MASLGIALLVAVALIDALSGMAELRRVARLDRRYVIRSLAGIALFLAWVIGGVIVLLAVMTQLPPDTDQRLALSITLAFLGWVLYGTLLLLRSIPSQRPLPRWLLRFGWMDLGLVVGTVVASTLVTLMN